MLEDELRCNNAVAEQDAVKSSRRAADLVDKTYVEIEKANLAEMNRRPNEFRHGLNVFFSRLVFCLFAEDMGLFEAGQLRQTIEQHTDTSGSDLDEFFKALFMVLSGEKLNGPLAPYLNFPDLGNTVFAARRRDLLIPKFNATARQLILECTNVDWGSINPDILGTIFQGAIERTRRNECGMDYTSTTNIMKVVGPLFLDNLWASFKESYDDEVKLNQLIKRLGKIKIFDPACGSGNFLVVAYKELRKLERQILIRLGALGYIKSAKTMTSQISLDHFYGIEIDDFAHELTILSLTIAARQCDLELEQEFGTKITRPLDTNQPVVCCANSVRVDWREICPNYTSNEIYVIGNPPYKGNKRQSQAQMDDFRCYFGNEEYNRNLDYIALWFIKGARYIANTRAKLAFVATKSVCQGEQVGLMFPKIYDAGVEISFAHTPFRWQNNAKENARASVIVLGLATPSVDKKRIYSDDEQRVREVASINPYLTEAQVRLVERRKTPLVKSLPKMSYGSMPIDGGFLTLDEDEMRTIENEVEIKKYIRPFIGGEEFIKNKKRYCLWIEDENYKDAMKNDWIRERVEAVQKYRNASKRATTRRCATRPYAFGEIRYQPTKSIIVPTTTSERREYIPMGYLDERTIISNGANAIYNAELWVFALLESRMHTTWIKAVCGYLGPSIRYSATLGYNTFPVPRLTQVDKEHLARSATEILEAREQYTEKSLVELYHPTKMPTSLRQAHIRNDRIVDQLYQEQAFENDEERLEVLFGLFEQECKNS